MSRVAISVLGVASAAFGCASLSGLDAQGDFSCKAPKGVSCASITAVHAAANAGTLPALRGGANEHREDRLDAPVDGGTSIGEAKRAYVTPGPPAAAAAAGSARPLSPAAMNAPTTGTPLRTPERVLRVWLAPFEDGDGDFHDQRYLYVTVNRGQWMVERARAAIRNQYQTVRPLSREKDSAGASASKQPQPVSEPAQNQQ